MPRLTAWILTFWIAALTGPAVQAQGTGNPVVVELFTSQGCSSCPAADALLAEMAGRADIIPLALHVDYWDYIGWKDAFAQARFTKRQKGYAHAAGERRIYTPQMIINGAEDVVGSRPMKVAALIQKHAMAPVRVSLDLVREGASLRITARALASEQPFDIQVVQYQPHREVMIEKGENAGLTVAYTHIVDDWAMVDRWDGTGTWEGSVETDPARPVVVLVQKPKYGRIVAAARAD